MMRRTLCLLVFAAGLSGCSHFGMTGRSIDPQFPQVSVVDGKVIVVNQEPVIARRGARIAWQLPRDSNLRFDKEKGIVVEAFLKPLTAPSPRPFTQLPESRSQKDPSGRSLFECKVGADEREFACTVPAGAKAGQYAYSVRVNAGSMYLILDPTIWVEE